MPLTINSLKKKFIHVDDVEETPAHEFQDLDSRIKATRIECVPIGDLKRNRRNARKHPSTQIALLAENYDEFGVVQPIVVDEDSTVICGHARLEAAEKAKLAHLPVVRLSGLSSAQKRALAIADNKLTELGEWELDVLAEELGFLCDPKTELSFDPRITGLRRLRSIRSSLTTNATMTAPIRPMKRFR